jgi:hypothetical protein
LATAGIGCRRAPSTMWRRRWNTCPTHSRLRMSRACFENSLAPTAG